MSAKIGMLGGLSMAQPSQTDDSVKITSGFIQSTFERKRLFSMGSVTIGGLRMDNAKIFWDIGAKVTVVFVPNKDLIGTEKLCSFAVTALDAGIGADVFPATIDLSGGITAKLPVGVVESPGEDTSFDSADVILGMDVIEKGSLRIDGPGRRWSFKVR